MVSRAKDFIAKPEPVHQELSENSWKYIIHSIGCRSELIPSGSPWARYSSVGMGMREPHEGC